MIGISSGFLGGYKNWKLTTHQLCNAIVKLYLLIAGSS